MTRPSAGPPQRFGFATRDQGEARERLAGIYGVQLQVNASRETDWLLSLDAVDAGAFSRIDITMPAQLRFDLEGMDDILIATVAKGVIGFERGKQEDRFVPGDVYIADEPRAGDIGWTHQARAITVTLPQDLFHKVAGGPADDDNDRAAAPMQALSYAPVAGGAARWRQVTRFVDELLDNPEACASPLLLGPAARLLAATALTVFPNTLVPAAAPEDRSDAHSGTLRRAIAYIDANPDLDLSLTDIARAAYVTPRAVQLAFRRHLNTTPLAYLRRVRLDRARADLLAATPGDGTTVTGVAARWGWGRPSRFAADYLAAYNRHPSQDLTS